LVLRFNKTTKNLHRITGHNTIELNNIFRKKLMKLKNEKCQLNLIPMPVWNLIHFYTEQEHLKSIGQIMYHVM
jgi:hypothetical protein